MTSELEAYASVIFGVSGLVWTWLHELKIPMKGKSLFNYSWRPRTRGQRLVKYEFQSQLSWFVESLYWSRNLLKLNLSCQLFEIPNKFYKKTELSAVVRVLQITQNIVKRACAATYSLTFGLVTVLVCFSYVFHNLSSSWQSVLLFEINVLDNSRWFYVCFPREVTEQTRNKSRWTLTKWSQKVNLKSQFYNSSVIENSILLSNLIYTSGTSTRGQVASDIVSLFQGRSQKNNYDWCRRPAKVEPNSGFTEASERFFP